MSVTKQEARPRVMIEGELWRQFSGVFRIILAEMRSAPAGTAGSACEVPAGGSHSFGQLPSFYPSLDFRYSARATRGVIKLHLICPQYGKLQISATRLLCRGVQKKSKK